MLRRLSQQFIGIKFTIAACKILRNLNAVKASDIKMNKNERNITLREI